MVTRKRLPPPVWPLHHQRTRSRLAPLFLSRDEKYPRVSRSCRVFLVRDLVSHQMVRSGKTEFAHLRFKLADGFFTTFLALLSAIARHGVTHRHRCADPVYPDRPFRKTNCG